MGRNYLIIKTSALGDVVQTIPVVSYLKAIDPDCQIDWIVEKAGAELLRALPLLDRVLVVDTKKWRSHPFASATRKEVGCFVGKLREKTYDSVFDLQGNTKSGILTLLSKGALKGGFGKKTVPEFLNLLFTNKKANPPEGLNITEDYLWVVSHLMDRELPEKIDPVQFKVDHKEAILIDSLVGCYQDPILLAPGSAWENKRLNESQLINLLNKQSEKTQIFLLWGNEGEFKICSAIAPLFANCSILPKLSLPAVQLLMSKMSLVISMDSLPLHLAATTDVPTLSFFGPSSGAKYAPKGSQHKFIQGKCPYGETFVKRCKKLRSCPTGCCIKNIKE